MPVFDFSFTVDAPVNAVSEFHYHTSALKTLTPPPIYVQLQEIEPMGEGSVSRFTLWLGPLPIRWQAVHSDVSGSGFTDTQVQGPAKKWVHTHSFTPINKEQTRVHEHIEYEHGQGFNGLLTRLLFAKPNLFFMFSYRKWITKRHLRSMRKIVNSAPTT
jgi:ligand-binding SRPBCC domain-containing protein